MWGVATCLLSASIPQAGKVPIHLRLLPDYGFHAPPQPEPEIPGREQERHWAQGHSAPVGGLPAAQVEREGCSVSLCWVPCAETAPKQSSS